MTEELLAIFAAIPGPPDDPDTLYARCYSRPISGPLPAGEPGDLSAANATREGIDSGWRVEQAAGEGCVIAVKGGAVRMFRPGQYLTLRGPGAKVEAGEPIRVIASRGAADLQPGFYHALGGTVSGYAEFEDLVRIYWNIAAHGAVPLMAALTTDFNRFGVPFRFKCGQKPEIYERRDSAVLYFHRRYFPIAEQLIARSHAAVAPWMRDGVPLFTQPLAKGLGFAEDPGESFGKNRCAILSESMAATRGLQPLERLEDLRQRFDTRGLSLDQPWLNARQTGHRPPAPRPLLGAPADRSPSSSQSDHVEIAARLAGRLCRDAIWSGGLCNWTADRPTGNSASHAALIPQVYTGTSGIAMALARMADATGDPIFRTTAEGAIACALSRMPVKGCGFYTGGLGVLYAAAEIRGEVDCAAVLRQAATDRMALDIMTGSAGAIPALLSFHRRVGSDALLDLALQHGDLLIDESVRDDAGWSWNTIGGLPGQTGFSHGVSGIAWSLLELWQATGEMRFRDAALEALRFERSCFDPARGRWADFRSGDATYESVWCHGSAGIALTRLRAWELLADPVLLDEARAAIADSAAAMLTLDNFSLCHGTAGCGDVLLDAAQILDDTSLISAVEDAARRGIELYERPARTWPGGVHRAVETPDLMWGLAGIALFYLRLGQPQRTATVLLPAAQPVGKR